MEVGNGRLRGEKKEGVEEYGHSTKTCRRTAVHYSAHVYPCQFAKVPLEWHMKYVDEWQIMWESAIDEVVKALPWTCIHPRPN